MTTSIFYNIFNIRKCKSCVYLFDFSFLSSQSKQNQSKHNLNNNLIEMILRKKVSLMVGFLLSDVEK